MERNRRLSRRKWIYWTSWINDPNPPPPRAFTAGAFGFLTFTQCDERPERYIEPRPLLTMPSQPIVSFFSRFLVFRFLSSNICFLLLQDAIIPARDFCLVSTGWVCPIPVLLITEWVRPVAALRIFLLFLPKCPVRSQPGPLGGALAGDGKHGSIIPSPGRVRSRNDMGSLIGTPLKRLVSVTALLPSPQRWSNGTPKTVDQ